jgi:hypothetical protein
MRFESTTLRDFTLVASARVGECARALDKGSKVAGGLKGPGRVSAGRNLVRTLPGAEGSERRPHAFSRRSLRRCRGPRGRLRHASSTTARNSSSFEGK